MKSGAPKSDGASGSRPLVDAGTGPAPPPRSAPARRASARPSPVPISLRADHLNDEVATNAPSRIKDRTRARALHRVSSAMRPDRASRTRMIDSSGVRSAPGKPRRSSTSVDDVNVPLSRGRTFIPSVWALPPRGWEKGTVTFRRGRSGGRCEKCAGAVFSPPRSATSARNQPSSRGSPSGEGRSAPSGARCFPTPVLGTGGMTPLPGSGPPPPPASTSRDRPAQAQNYHISAERRQAPPTASTPPRANNFRRRHAHKSTPRQRPWSRSSPSLPTRMAAR